MLGQGNPIGLKCGTRENQPTRFAFGSRQLNSKAGYIFDAGRATKKNAAQGLDFYAYI